MFRVNKLSVQNLKPRVEAADNLKISEGKNNNSNSVDRVPIETKQIKLKSNSIEKRFNGPVIGERYNIE